MVRVKPEAGAAGILFYLLREWGEIKRNKGKI